MNFCAIFIVRFTAVVRDRLKQLGDVITDKVLLRTIHSSANRTRKKKKKKKLKRNMCYNNLNKKKREFVKYCL